MNLQTRKLNLIEFLTKTENSNLLKAIEDIIQNASAGSTSEKMSREELRMRISTSEKDLSSGHFTTQNDLEQLSKNW